MRAFCVLGRTISRKGSCPRNAPETPRKGGPRKGLRLRSWWYAASAPSPQEKPRSKLRRKALMAYLRRVDTWRMDVAASLSRRARSLAGGVLSVAVLTAGCGAQPPVETEALIEPSAQRSEKPGSRDAGSQESSLLALTQANAERRSRLASSAKVALRDYYAAIDAQRFEAAWGRLTAGQRAAFGGDMSAWRAGYDETLEHFIEVRSSKGFVRGNRATVTYAITAVDTTTCESEFRSTARMRKADGRWTIEQLQGRAVGEPICPERAAAEPEPEEVPDALSLQDIEPADDEPAGGGGCHSSYSGCVPDEGYDVDCGELGDTDIDVYGDDEYGLDADGDGIGCES